MKQLIISLFFFLSVTSIYACRCDEVDFETAYKHTNLIIHGKVLERIHIAPKTILQGFEDSFHLERDKETHDFLSHPTITKVTIKVIKLYKGTIKQDTISIFTGRHSSACGFTYFQQDEYQDFIIYASNQTKTWGYSFKKPIFWTTYCTRSTVYFKEEANNLEQLIQKEKAIDWVKIFFRQFLHWLNTLFNMAF